MIGDSLISYVYCLNDVVDSLLRRNRFSFYHLRKLDDGAKEDESEMTDVIVRLIDGGK